MLEGEEEQQEIENLFEKNNEGNFPHLVKEIDTQVQEEQRVPNKLNPKRTTPKHILTKMPNVKDKERISKAVREKQRATFPNKVKLKEFLITEPLLHEMLKGLI